MYGRKYLQSTEVNPKEYISDASRWGEFDENRWAGFYNWLNGYYNLSTEKENRLKEILILLSEV